MDSEAKIIPDLPRGNMRLVQQKRPVLPPGDYTIQVDHEIKAKNRIEDTIRASKRFSVRGERFQLPEASVHATYPPSGGKGGFSNALPHIVLSADTLPWERSAVASDDATPWLALLLFYEEELDKLKTDTLKLNDLHRPHGWLESGEDGEAQCTVLEIPDDLLGNVVPDREEMAWLCHVRQVNNANKADTADTGTVDYAVVIGNRRPQSGCETGKINRVHLVSLEGYYDPQRKAWYAPNEGMIQLVCLASWAFSSTPSPFTFDERMGNLDAGVLKVERQTQDPHLATIVSSGFTLLHHQMRQGSKTASLYRGPLVPCDVPPSVDLPISCGDEAVRLYAQWGLMDVSYAAAWQLGRLLALGNREFAAMLYQWKVERRRTVLVDQGLARAEKVLGPVARARIDASGTAEQDDRFGQVARWLGELTLLSGVPLHYLLPDIEQMLPDNTVRFFRVDMNWINSLLDGAFSLGRETTTDWASDRALFDTVCNEALRRARTLRRGGDAPVDADATGEPAPMSGAIIRSDAIAHWPGLEVDALGGDDGHRRLPPLRMARIADDMLICIFEGGLDRVGFYPPAEGMHYDVQPPGTPTVVRQVNGGEDYDVHTAEKGAAGRVDIAGLAGAIQRGAGGGQAPFTAAQFALSLIATSRGVTFTRDSQDRS